MTYRNKKLLALAEKAPYCFHCRSPQYGQVVGSHCDSQQMGKGTAHKAADVVAYLCNDCHSIVSGVLKTGLTKEARECMWYKAACLTMVWVLENYPETFR